MADTIGVQPTLPIGGSTDGFMGGAGNGSWFIILFILLLLGRNGGGLFGGADTNTVVGLTNEGLLLRQSEAINAASNRTNDNMAAGFAGVNSALCAIQHQADMNTCDIKTTVHAEGEATRALINGIEAQNLRERLLAAENALNNAQQTSNIVNSLRPYPTPSYLTVPPGTPFGYGYGYGCGCNPCNPCW